MPFKSYKKTSRDADWGTNIPETQTMAREDIKFGCLLRIADSLEAMSNNYTGLLNRVKQQGEYIKTLESQAEHNDRRIASLKGVITKMKKYKKP